MKPPKVKYTVSLPKKVSDKLEALSEAESMSKPETLRRAISLYSFIYKELAKDGQKVCIVDANDQIVKEIVVS